MIEAYPSPDGRAYRYMGTRELYRAAGFEEVPVPPGRRPVMRATIELARHAERLGFRRFWVAEHHNMPGIEPAIAGPMEHPAGLWRGFGSALGR